MKKISLILGLSAAILVSCHNESNLESKNNQANKAIKVKTIVAKQSSAVQHYSYSGIVIPQVNIPLSFQLPGSVTKIYVDEGDFVEKNQLLAELDKTSYMGTYEVALAMQQQAQDAYERLKTVYNNGSLPEIQWEEIKSKLQQANSSVTIAKKNLDNCQVKAPSFGIIGKRKLETGSTVTPGFTVFNLVNIKKVYIKISVPENEINKLKKGQKSLVKIPAIGEKIYEGKIEKIGVMADLLSKTYEVKVLLDNPELIIKPGMACDLDVNISEKETSVELPFQAVLKDENQNKYVFVVDEKTKTAIKRNIKADKFSNNMLLVSSGVKKGEKVIVNGQHKLTNNTPVNIL